MRREAKSYRYEYEYCLLVISQNCNGNFLLFGRSIIQYLMIEASEYLKDNLDILAILFQLCWLGIDIISWIFDTWRSIKTNCPFVEVALRTNRCSQSIKQDRSNELVFSSVIKNGPLSKLLIKFILREAQIECASPPPVGRVVRLGVSVLDWEFFYRNKAICFLLSIFAVDKTELFYVQRALQLTND